MTSTSSLPQTSITHELDHPNSRLRQLLVPNQALLTAWRQQLLGELNGRPCIRPERIAFASMAGHATDYRARWFLTGVDALPDAVLHGLTWCHDLTVRELLSAFDVIVGAPAGPLDSTTERAVCAVAIAAASIEPLYRAGHVPCALADLGMNRFQAEHIDVLDDVITLAAGFPTLLERYAGTEIHSGPIASTGCMAGDADFIADGELVEIKCTINPRAVATRALQQMFVYAARLQPTAAAILLPRQQTLVRFDLSGCADLLCELDAQICAAYNA